MFYRTRCLQDEESCLTTLQMDSESAVETLVPVYQTKRPHIQKDWDIDR
jgi:hypothetical protein